jgi:light-regulated signal transduction histidine kinase (bacteriophytochrome)
MSREEDLEASCVALRRANAELVHEKDDLVRELQRARQELDGMSYAVSHDLRAPLRAIDGFSRALAADYSETLDDTARTHLDRISAGVLRMNGLIEGLLELVRLSRADLHWEDLDLSSLAAGVVADLRAREPHREVIVEIDADLSAPGDPHLLRHLFGHLLGNAWKFSSHAEASRIEVRRDPHAPRTFFVRDNGVGFDMAYTGHLFAPFQRLHRAKEFEGTGIGLAMAQRIVLRHGGRIWADAVLGSGASFYFTLPADAPVASGRARDPIADIDAANVRSRDETR